MEGIQILDNIVSTHEVIHSFKFSKELGMMVKLDPSKAYDWLSWKFLLSFLKVFGFDED